MGAQYGVTYRESRLATGTQVRVRGGAVVRGEIVMLDLAGSESSATAAPGAIGTQTVEGSPLATVLAATTGLQVGRVGVMLAAASDNGIGLVEMGEIGDGAATPIVVEALVVVGSSAIEGAALQVSSYTLADALGGVTAVLAAGGGSGATYAILLESATTDDKGGPSSAVNYKRVLLHSAGVAAAPQTGQVTNADLATDAPLRRNRYAATSGLGAASTAGAFASFTWDPGQDVTVSFVYATAVAPSATVTVLGSASASGWNVRFLTTGEIQFREATTERAITAAGVALYDGLPHTVSLRVTGTTVAITHDGVAVSSGTFSSVTWANVPYFIGAGAASVSQRFPGTIYNVTGVDHTDTSAPFNDFTYLMDEPSGNFINTATTTGVGNATRNGYVPMTAVVSTDGRGMPWQGGGAVVYEATRAGTDQVMDGSVATTYVVTYDAEVIDPTGSLVHTTGVWTAPCAGTALVSMDLRFATSGVASDVLDYGIRKNSGASSRTKFFTLLSTALGQNVSSFWTASVAAGDTIDVAVSNIDPTNTTLGVDLAAMRIQFIPTPVAG